MKTKLFAIILGVFLISGIVSCTKEPVSVVQTDNNTKKENVGEVTENDQDNNKKTKFITFDEALELIRNESNDAKSMLDDGFEPTDEGCETYINGLMCRRINLVRNTETEEELSYFAADNFGGVYMSYAPETDEWYAVNDVAWVYSYKSEEDLFYINTDSSSGDYKFFIDNSMEEISTLIVGNEDVDPIVVVAMKDKVRIIVEMYDNDKIIETYFDKELDFGDAISVNAAISENNSVLRIRGIWNDGEEEYNAEWFGNCYDGMFSFWKFVRELHGTDAAFLDGKWTFVSAETDGYEYTAAEVTFDSEITISENIANYTYSDDTTDVFNEFEAELELINEPVYEGCGNDLWSVKLNIINGYNQPDEEYYATLTDENTLLLQHLFPFDGTQGVSYTTYTRKNARTNQKAETISLIAGTGEVIEFDEDTYQNIISASIPVVHAYYGDENTYPALEKALNAHNEKEEEYQFDFIYENLDYAKESYGENPEYFYEFESDVIPFVRRADTFVTSILYQQYTYAGGIHGNYYYYGKNYDTQTGKLLKLSNVINDKDQLVTAIYEQLDKYLNYIEFDDSLDMYEVLSDENLFSWTLDYNGITLYFSPYSIASYANGIQVVNVSNEEYPDVLNEEYKNVPESYGIELAYDTPHYYDVTGDGEVDEILFSAYVSDEGEPGEVSFYINGRTFDEENWLYDAEATFVHAENGKNYIYLEILRENDYRETVCYEISDEIKKVGSLDGGLRKIYHEGEYFILTKDVLTNPNSFCLQSSTHLLSTVTGHKQYHIGENGIPQTNDVIFKFDEENMFTFTMLSDLEADVYDMEKGKRTGKKKTLKQGEKVTYIATDNEAYGYLKTSDGTVICVEAVFDKENYWYVIDGVNIEEIFDGVMYAG